MEGRLILMVRIYPRSRRTELADLRRTKMGFIFQQPTLLKNLNILDNIILPSMNNNKEKSTEIDAKARMLMEKADITELEESEYYTGIRRAASEGRHMPCADERSEIYFR